MIDFLKNMFTPAPEPDLKAWLNDGGIVLDVRTKGEYQGGHIKGSKNIPLQVLAENIASLDKSKPVITCCASGMRSASARDMLKEKGFERVYNGGGWHSLNSKLGL